MRAFRAVVGRLAFAVASFLGVTVVTFAILAASKPMSVAEDARGDPTAAARIARLTRRYALDRPLFWQPDPPDASRIPHAARVAEAIPRLLEGDALALRAGLEALRADGAPVPGFGAADDAALRRDVSLWWRRHQNSFRERGPLWRASVGHVIETRYAAWLGDLVRLDFGDSLTIRPEAPVARLLRERLPPTLLLMGVATMVLFLIGIPIGVLCAARRGGFVDRAIQTALFVLHATPEFFVATLALVYLSSDAHWRIFPVGGLLTPEIAAAIRGGAIGRFDGRVIADLLHHLVLPVTILVLPACVVVVRHVRAAAIETLGSRFVTAARARGLSERRILFVHVLRSCAAPVIALFTSVLPGLVTGSILIEFLFSMQGMGMLTWEAATYGDFPVGMAILTIVAIVMLGAHMMGDVLHALVDPRVRSA